MNDLLKLTIEAHGGLENWNKFNNISAHLKVDGLTWIRKQQPGIINDTYVSVSTKKQSVSFQPVYADWKTSFEPDQVAALTLNNEIIEELSNPRQSFINHKRETPWTRLQAFYFASYAIWIYFNAPFCFANPAFEVTEIDPWKEDGEAFRRLKVIFPETVESHSRIQTFYIDKNGLIRRHDYNVEISENVASAHYLYDYIEVQGIKFPSKRQVFIRNYDNTSLQPEPVLVVVNVVDVALE
ncbi:MAG: hypothetical protein DI622_13650 [Chryseobacterium sp.]|uniref:hypothetical protein n=1 Tax=Chryseobacterium sp. TaxID=1871047 RepID=UPI000DB56582|nr:hypothetical protein [Chryseobacterium sp.]MPS66812.1 hypothetical protein [Chryseobacterium sp.]PZU14109.1 MAG: hypothetical protein DI622_13650 [Chryseobacterium sp.]